MKEAFNDVLQKQVDRITEIMKFSSPKQEKIIRGAILKSLHMSIARKNKHLAHDEPVVIDAHESQLYKFAVALRSSKNEIEFKQAIKRAFPAKSDMYYRDLMARYTKVFLNTIQYNFPISQIEKKEKEAKMTEMEFKFNAFQDLIIKSMKEVATNQDKRIRELESKLNHVSHLLTNHIHGNDGKSAIIVTLTEINEKEGE